MRGFLPVQSVPIAIYEGLFGSAKCSITIYEGLFGRQSVPIAIDEGLFGSAKCPHRHI